MFGMTWWQILLFPIAILYNLITSLRNHLYSIGNKTSIKFETNVISVGNLAVGGTGKSPMIDFLIQHFLNKHKKIASLSRGYGRKTRGYRKAGILDSANTIGDEPMAFFLKFGDRLTVAVAEQRAIAIPFILADQNDIEVILLDDAFQHRAVAPSFSILLSTVDRPFYNDYLMPSGRLREARKGVSRADVICFTKAPKELSPSERAFIIENTRSYNEQAPIFFSYIAYGGLVRFGQNKVKDKIIGVAGLADSTLFKEYLMLHFDLKGFYDFGDHHDYSMREVKDIVLELMANEAMLVTTEKDFVKLRIFDNLLIHSCFYLPIQMKFLEGEAEFLRLVDNSLGNYTGPTWDD
ncbi:MAG: tetraacyldisaccharide 4'-kinase [Flammeovirgaceae bacterium]|jgi:tetraacyldisaccharide 4'-kinase|nr:tetraacyldisaccharide 4'-kinase [Flammeovirgaceae bacterium]|tara:strand:+ start:5412 stop:6464 length:1053 start_codon:yes stop_codon:yes gene_type:complete